jgi:hypothetical protein
VVKFEGKTLQQVLYIIQVETLRVGEGAEEEIRMVVCDWDSTVNDRGRRWRESREMRWTMSGGGW